MRTVRLGTTLVQIWKSKTRHLHRARIVKVDPATKEEVEAFIAANSQDPIKLRGPGVQNSRMVRIFRTLLGDFAYNIRNHTKTYTHTHPCIIYSTYIYTYNLHIYTMLESHVYMYTCILYVYMLEYTVHDRRYRSTTLL